MNELEQAGLARLRDGWISGGAFFELAPDEWKDVAAASSPDEQERRLLAIAAQALDVALRPAAPKTLKRRSPLPVLTLPMLPDRLRPLLRAALKHAADARRKALIVKLAAGRGFVTHPMDWMPAASDQNAPDIYAPWIDWQANAEQERQGSQEKLSLENWTDFYPAARRVALAAMRRSEPAAARQLIEAKAPAESAEVRLSLVELIRIGLGPDDAPFLNSLAGDRSGKVRELAGRMLAMLGEHGEGGPDDAVTELAGFIEEGKAGFIRRRTIFGPVKTKSHAQEQRRAELFDLCNLVDLAARLGVTESDFITGWQFGTDNNADILLSRMVAASGSDAAVAQMADTLVAAGKPALFVLHLTPRLDSRRQRALIRQFIKDAQLPAALGLAQGVDAGWLDWDDLSNGRFLAVLRNAISAKEDPPRRAAEEIIETIGYLATAPAAANFIDEVVAAGLPPASPSLGLLRLNAALAGNPTQPDR